MNEWDRVLTFEQGKTSTSPFACSTHSLHSALFTVQFGLFVLASLDNVVSRYVVSLARKAWGRGLATPQLCEVRFFSFQFSFLNETVIITLIRALMWNRVLGKEGLC